MKKGIICAFLIATLIVFSMSICYSAGNLLKNPSLEDGDFPPTGWVDWSGSESQNPDQDGIAGFPPPKKLSHSGYKSAGKILYGTGMRWGGISQTVDIKGGGKFQASGWVMNKKGDVALGKGAEAFIEVKFLDSDENEIKKVKSNTITQPTKWIKLSMSGVAPRRAKQAVFSFVVTGPKGSKGKIYFDDASLEISR